MADVVPQFIADPTMCSNETEGQTCFWEYGDKGGVLYNEYDSCSKTAILLPGFNLLPNWFLAIVYGLTLTWSFFGIAIISDTFMSAIEVITSLEREVKRRGNDGSEITLKVLVWNASVANLTLMALGSSAPEIMIAVIETVVTLGDTPGEIGPSTIVDHRASVRGSNKLLKETDCLALSSAAFNLLLISAVCIVAVPEGQFKSITQFSVFIWTAFMSVFAYFWMLVVYQFWTPDEVTIVEAVLTLLFLPLLVGVAYVLDCKPWKPQSEEGADGDALSKQHLYQVVVGAHGTGETGQEYTVTKEEIQDYLSYHSHLGQEMEESDIAQIIAEARFHRANSNPAVTLHPQALRPSFRQCSSRPARSSFGGASDLDHTTSGTPAWYERASIDRTTVMQQLEQIQSRRDNCGLDPDISEEDIQSVVRSVQSKQAKNDMSALQYRINARNALTGRTHLAVAYPSASQAARLETPDLKRSSAPPSSTLDQVPKLMFASQEYRVLESQKGLRVMVRCARPAQAKDTAVTVNYTTRDGSARGGDDYAVTSGQLRFEPGVFTQVIEIVVFEDDLVEDDEDFFVDLSEPTPDTVHIQKPTARVTIVDTTESGVVQFPHTHISVVCTKDRVQVPVIRKGGCNGAATITYATQTDTAASGIDFEHTAGRLSFESGESHKMISIPLIGTPKIGTFMLCLKAISENSGIQISRRRAMCSIEIVSDERADNVNTLVDRILDNADATDGDNISDWVQQFRDAVIPGRELDEEGEPQQLQTTNIIFHYISITWKLLFAIIPPPEMYSGGPCFFVSLMMIGGLTYFVAPIASMFGCAVGLSDLMTAIVFVAIGTSLPDTFASHQAAVQADDADAAIGNVTGSNCVNVFLGLGLPWLIASLYYEARGKRYLTPAGPLSFSVMIFMICASVCLVLLMIKRFRGGELGGRGFWRRGVAVILVFLWLFYLIMSGLQDTGKIEWNSRR